MSDLSSDVVRVWAGERSGADPGQRLVFVDPLQTLTEMFWSQVSLGDGCWEWIGDRDKNGYGIFRGPFQSLAHRFAYAITVSPHLSGISLLHSCDNPPCVRPSHLRRGTRAENIADMVSKGRHRQGPVRFGEQSHTAKVTEEMVRKIRQEYAEGGLTQRIIAERYGVTQSQVSNIVRRKQWRHI